MRKSILLLPVILGLVYIIATGYSTGYPGDRTGADGGTVGCSGGGCHHATTTPTVAVSISLDSAGTTVTHYVAGMSYNIKLVGINNTSSTLPKFGFELCAVKLSGSGSSSLVDAGTYGTLPSTAQNIVASGSHHIIEQTGAVSPSSGGGSGGGATTYTMTIPWTAPAGGTGPVKLYGLINAVNNDGSASTADLWNTGADTVTEEASSVAPITGGTTVLCSSGSTDTTRFFDVTTGGTWSSSATSVATVSSSGLVTAVGGGTTVISYATGSGTATTTVTVVALPSPGTIVGTTTMCSGTDTTLVDTTSGGVWSSGSTSVATITAGGRVHAITAGTVSIYYQITRSPCTVVGAIHNITISAPPNAGFITGSSTVCPGTTAAMSESVSGGTWSSSNPAIATISSTGVVTGLTAGTCTISYGISGSCGTAYAPHTITVIPSTNAGAISGASFICSSTSVNLSETVSTGTWSLTNTTLASISSSGRVTASSGAGVDTVKYTVTGSCGTSVAYFYVTIANTAHNAAGRLTQFDSICVGGTAYMTDSAGTTGGVWTSRSTAVASVDAYSGRVYALDTGTSIISYLISTSTCGSDTTARHIVVYQALPGITGATVTCVLAQDSLFNGVSGGLWSSSNSSVAQAAAGYGVITGVSAGSAVITYTSAAGCRISTPFTVNPIPAAITGTFNVCPGATVNLADATSGGVWSSLDTFTAKVNATGTVKGIAANTTTIRYTFPATGCHVSATMLVNPLPAFIMGQPIICEGVDDSLSDLTAGGKFSVQNASFATIDSMTGFMHSITGGTEIVTYTLPTGCFSTKPIIIHPLPTAPLTFIWYANYFKTGNYYQSYQWYRDGIAISGANDSTVAAAFNGTYSVYVRDSFGCQAMSSSYTITNLGVSQSTVANNIVVAPNPASDVLNIESPIEVNVVLSNMEGKFISRVDHAHSLNIASLPNGIYLLSIFDESGTRIRIEKIVKQ